MIFCKEGKQKMAWRPNEYLIKGQLDNTSPGKVTGWMKFAGLENNVIFDLNGNFHRDIRGAGINLYGHALTGSPSDCSYMECFSLLQEGKVGDITAGLPPQDYASYPYIEWYSHDNGRVVIELEPYQIEVIGRPIPACESDPISRIQQDLNLFEFLMGLNRPQDK